MRNHSRRAAPPPHLIRLYSPTGLERVAQMDHGSRLSPTFAKQHRQAPVPSALTASVDLISATTQCCSSSSCSASATSPAESDTMASVASSDCKSQRALLTPHDPTPPAYFDLRMKWCKGTLPQLDSLPTSVSMDSILRTPRSAAFCEGDHLHTSVKNISSSSGNDGRTIDWLSKLADSTLRFEGEVLLILQSDHDPRRKTEA